MKNKLLALEYHYVSDSPEKPIFVCFSSEVLHVTMRASLPFFSGQGEGEENKSDCTARILCCLGLESWCGVLWQWWWGFSLLVFSLVCFWCWLVGLGVLFGFTLVWFVFLSALLSYTYKMCKDYLLSIAAVSK